MKNDEVPATSAVRALVAAEVAFKAHLYNYEEHGGTRVAATSVGAAEHEVVKTLVMETDTRKPLLVLMHGDREVSTRQLARILDVKRITPCDPQSAHRHTGYTVGGISPFGTRNLLPVYIEETIFDLPRIFINGGKRGFLVEIEPSTLERVLQRTQRVAVALDKTVRE